MCSNTLVARSRRAIKLVAFLTLALCELLIAVSSAQAQTFTVLHTFTGPPDGNHPIGGLILDAAGNLYGTTSQGGASYRGTVFRLTPAGKETVLYSFDAGYGEYPNTTLVRDAKGALYGTTFYGGAYNKGAVFKLDTKGNETVLYSFRGGADGYWPNAVIRDAQDNLYGTTDAGGKSACGYGCGTVFKLDKAGRRTTLYRFTGGTDGMYPSAGLVRDSAGNLYSVTGQGGDLGCNRGIGCGTVFKLDTAGRKSVLYIFTGASGDGDYPVGVVRDKNGTFYGATSWGGNYSCGTVFRLEADGKETVLHGFTGTGGDGCSPPSGVVLDTSGNIYGTTQSGGVNYGVVFKLDTAGKETILHSFTDGTDGAYPYAGVMLGKAGNIYGVASDGGDHNCGQHVGCGTVFKLTP